MWIFFSQCFCFFKGRIMFYKLVVNVLVFALTRLPIEVFHFHFVIGPREVICLIFGIRCLLFTSWHLKFEEIYRRKGTRKQQQLAGKGTTAGSMLCFTVSMLKARLSNCAADKTLVSTQNILSVLMCGCKTFVPFLHQKLRFQIYPA